MHQLGFYRISALTPANPESDHFMEIRPSLALAKFIAACQCSCSMDKTSAADLSSGVFTILISVTLAIKIQNSFHSTNFIKNWQTVA